MRKFKKSNKKFALTVLLIILFPQLVFAKPATCNRIISLAPSITEILFKLRLGKKLVGITRYCNFPPETQKIKKVGGFWDPNLELVAALKPDTVFLFSEDLKTQNLLKAMKTNYVAVNHKNLAGILASINLIAAHCGYEQEGSSLLKTLHNQIDLIRERVKNKPKKRVLVAVGRTSLSKGVGNFFISGTDGFYSDLLAIAGGKNVLKRSTVPLPSLSYEGLISLKPELIIEIIPDLTKRGWHERDVIAAWETMPYLPAVKDKQVHVLSAQYTAVPGPRFTEILKDFVVFLHGEA